MTDDEIIALQTIPFQGGVDLFHEPVTLQNGGYSQIQNFRPRRPGLESRLGQTRHHTTTANGSKEIISGYGFSKGRRTERAIFAQYDDGSVEKGNDNPPSTTTGDFSTVETLEESYEGSQNTSANVFGDGGLGEAQAQEFKVNTEFEAIKVSLSLKKTGSPTDNITARIETDNAGLPSGTLVDANATSTIAASSLTASYAWEDFTFPDTFTLSTSTVYHLVLIRSAARDETNYCQWAQDNTSPSYADGEREKKDNGTWANDATSDLLFRVYSRTNATVLAARSGASPASWGNFRDFLLYADGAGAAEIYTGEQQRPVLVNVYKGSAMPDVPVEGADYLDEATDGLSTTVVVLDSLSTLAAFDGFFLGFDTPINKITLTVSAANATASVATLHYRKDDSTWASASATDGTASGGASIAQTGSFTWTLPTDEVPHYAFGISCFLYRITFSVALDSEVEISAVTGENTAGFQDVQNIWDGRLQDAGQFLTYDASASVYYKYSGLAVKMTDFTWAGGANDYGYLASIDKLFGLFLDPGKTPNITGSSSIDEIAVWTDTGWTAVTGLNDGTAGGANAGHVTWVRNDNARKTMFKGDITAYWYRIRFDTNVAGDNSITWAFSTMPYFKNIYPVCQSLSAWDKRMWYSFDSNILHGTATGFPMSLNGDDKVILEIGDFRSNKIVAMRRFYNFMLVWQEEKGEEGGGLHIIEPGTTATGYASQVVSDKIGIMNSKSAVVLEDVGMVDMNTERPVMKGVYFLSRYGVYKTDGSFLKNISGGIENYFDSSKTEIIRAGYEDKHFLVWDSLYQILRLGLASGSSATKPNVFFIYDYINDQWAQDDLAQPLSSMFEVEAASGNVPVLQMGGTQDGYVMRLNNTNDDISTAIDKSVKVELDGMGWQIHLKSMVVLMESKAAGDLIVDIYRKGESTPDLTETLTMINANADYRGHRFNPDVKGDHLTIRFRNAVASQPVYLLKYGLDVERIESNVAYE